MGSHPNIVYKCIFYNFIFNNYFQELWLTFSNFQDKTENYDIGKYKELSDG